EDHPIRLLGFLRGADLHVVIEQRSRFTAGSHLIVAGLFREIAVRREEQRLGEIDALVFVITGATERAAPTAAAASAASTTSSVQPYEPEDDLLRLANTGCEVHGFTAIERHVPQIVLVIEDDGLSVLRPSRDAIDRLLVRVIIILVHEGGLLGRRELRRARRLEIVDKELLILQVQERLAIGRRAHSPHEARLDRRALARLGVNSI